MIVPAGEKIAETKSCRSCAATFHITDRDLEFYDKISPAFGGKKESVPSPTLCPDCRQRRRLAFRNERKLYKRKCDLTGRDIVSMYSPDKLYPVYDLMEWKSDRYDPLEYGIGMDFSRPLFAQLAELVAKTPKQSIFGKRTNENAVYNNYMGDAKNCYLVFDSMATQDCAYGLKVTFSRDCLDCDYVVRSENCYECTDCMRCYGVSYSSYSTDCRDSAYLADCVDCSDCFACKGLKSGRYCLLNVRYSPEEYVAQKRRLLESGFDHGTFRAFCTGIPSPHAHLNGVEDALGNNLENCKNANFCFDSFDLEDCKYCSRLHTSKDCQDYESWGQHSSLVYEAIWVGDHSQSVAFSVCAMSESVRTLYSIFTPGCVDCFACVGLKDAKFCILNKQYAEEEYNALVPKIIAHMRETGEWGEFFDPSVSPFGYDETVAMEYFPLTKEEAIAQGFNWSDYEAPFPKVDRIIPAAKLPEKIADIPDDILNWAIECEVTKRPYRIIKQELEFYRKHGLPVPRRHPDRRHLDRLALRNPRKIYERECDKCHADMVTTYAPDRPERVYCEGCYRREVYG